MQIRLRFPIKGTYYYSAQSARETGIIQVEAQLNLIKEPENEHDPFAIQIWLSKQLLGYVPRQLAYDFRHWSQKELEQFNCALVFQHPHRLESRLMLPWPSLNWRQKIIFFWRSLWLTWHRHAYWRSKPLQ